MGNREFTKLPFGFLNVAQDATNIEEAESSDVRNIDPDALALGSLKYQNFSGISTSAKNYLETNMNGRKFFLGGHDRYATYTSANSLQCRNSVSITQKYGNSFIGFEVYFENTNDGFVLGNDLTGVANYGRFSFHMGSGDLICFQHDSVSSQTATVISSAQTGRWYRVVMYDRQGAEGTMFFVDGVRTAIVPYGSGSSPTILYAGTIRFGRSPANLLTFRLSDFLWRVGVADSPASWDGTLSSIGPVEDESNLSVASSIVLSFRNGLPYQNPQGMLWYSVGTSLPSSNSNTTSATGELFTELDDSDVTVEQPSVTVHNVDGSGGTTSQRIDEYMPVSTNKSFFFSTELSFDIYSSGVSDGTSNPTGAVADIFSMGVSDSSPKAFKVELWQPTSSSSGVLQLAIQDNTGSFGVYHQCKANIMSGGRFRFTFVVYEETIGSETDTVLKVFIDGKQTVFKRFSTPLAIFDSTASTQHNLRIPNHSALLSGVGTYYITWQANNIFMGHIKPDQKEKIPFWDGTKDDLNKYVNLWVSAPDGDLTNNEQALSASGDYSSKISSSSFTSLPTPIDKVNDEKGPITPEAPRLSTENDLVIDHGLPAGLSISIQEGKAYNGPTEGRIDVKNIWAYHHADHTTLNFGYRTGATGPFNKQPPNQKSATCDLPYNLSFSIDKDEYGSMTTNLSSKIIDTSEYTILIRSSQLLDGKYKYIAVAVRNSDISPKADVLSIPSKSSEIVINNIDEAGERGSNDIPVVKIPAASPGYPLFTDRVDLYRKDPDGDQFVKIAENKNSGAISFSDKTPITELPRIEFLPNVGVESFEKINEAVGNSSGTFEKVFNKDNRVFVVPTGRQDLLLYSDENAWWQWRRENTFRFNGNIVELTPVRDTSVLTGQQTLIVSTTTGIYHLIGNGTEEIPYEVIPVIGGDGHSDLEVMSGSQINANGSIFLITKSADGSYEAGAYGQKVYQYDLQKLVEISGRIRDSEPLKGTGALSYATLVAGDKYVLKKSDQTLGLVYHKDARGWVYLDPNTSGWKWTSRYFTRDQLSRGTPAFAKQFKVDFIGSVTVRFYIEQKTQGDVQVKEINLSSIGFRKEYQNMMPSGMGRKWWLELEGDIESEVYGLWFVQ